MMSRSNLMRLMLVLRARKIIFHSLKAIGLVDDILDCRATTLQSQDQLILFSKNLVALCHSLVNVGLSNCNLLFILSLVLGKLGALEVRLDSQPQLPPEPGLTNVPVPNGALKAIKSKLLVLHFLKDQPGGFSSCLRLQPCYDTADPVFTNFLHVTQNTSPEEDFGVSQAVLFSLKLNGVQDSLCSSLIVLGLGNSSSSQDIVSGLELRVQHLVGEALTADSNTSQHSITLVLVHNKARLNSSRNLVGVGDNTTDKGRISSIQGLHEVIKLGLVE